MALEVTSRSGKDFWRCGIRFGAEPTIVGREKLNQQFDSPVIHRKSPTIAQVLEAEAALICREVPEPSADSSDAEPSGDAAGGRRRR